jgi:hypothetical protein
MSIKLDDLDIQMKNEFKNSFAENGGVIFPTIGNQKYYTLKYYYINKNKVLKKGEIESYVGDCLSKKNLDLQEVRHLGKQAGFYILQGGEIYNNVKLKKGEYVFTGFDKINPFFNDKRRKSIPVDFEECKSNFNYQCATCGSKEGELHRFTKQPTLLEKGHKNPELSLDLSNLIPQCEFCNKKYKNRFIFDDFGQIKCYTTKELEIQYEKIFSKS